jgi:hypothetical protein
MKKIFSPTELTLLSFLVFTTLIRPTCSMTFIVTARKNGMGPSEALEILFSVKIPEFMK